MKQQSLKSKIYAIIEADRQGDLKSRLFDWFLGIIILVNIFAIILETVEPYRSNYAQQFYFIELFSIGFFTLEYICRFWVADQHPALSAYTAKKARFVYLLTPYAIIDLVAILPFYLTLILPIDLRILRVFRLLRFLKLARYSPALSTIFRVFKAEKRALIGTLIIMLSILLLASTFAYMAEHQAQPEKFGSIPQAMWWSLATLTTVGYGDVVPVTVTGKIIGGFVMLFGLAMFALPIGIIATGFSQEIHRRDFVINWSMVAKVELFAGLGADTILSLTRLLQSRSLPAGSLIAQRGDQAQCMYMVVSGRVSLFFEEDQEAFTVQPGEHFGEMALLRKSRRRATIIADTDCELLILEAPDLLRLMETDKELRQRIKEAAKIKYQKIQSREQDSEMLAGV